jgi:hypothetical protein
MLEKNSGMAFAFHGFSPQAKREKLRADAPNCGN